MSKSSPAAAGLSRRGIIKATAALAAGIAAPSVLRLGAAFAAPSAFRPCAARATPA